MSDHARLDHLLTARLHRVARLSDRDAGSECLAACGLHASEARCLAAIGSSEPLSINDLARRSSQDKGQASRSTATLVAAGLVAKEASPTDRRAAVLTLTKKGRALLPKTLRWITERNAATFAVLSTAERKSLGDLLERVALALESA